MKNESIYGLDKVPDTEIIKSQNIEIGMLNSTILELEDRIKSTKHVEDILNRNKNLENKNKSLTDQLKASETKHEELLDRFRILNRQYNSLQLQLLTK